MRLGKTGPHRRKEGGKGQHLMLERGIALKTRKEKQKTNSIYKNINTRNQSEYGEHHPHFQGMFPSAFTLSHYTHSPTSIWKGKTQFVLKWKAWKETKREKKAKEHLLSPKTLSPADTLAAPFQQCYLLGSLLYRTTNQTQSPQQTDNHLKEKIYSCTTRVTLGLLLLLLLEKPDWNHCGKKPSCVSHCSHPEGPGRNPEDSWKQLLWDQLQLGGKKGKRVNSSFITHDFMLASEKLVCIFFPKQKVSSPFLLKILLLMKKATTDSPLKSPRDHDPMRDTTPTTCLP